MGETIYSNFKMYSPDNILMCYISSKKSAWYLKRNLAELIDNHSIKLKFQPKGTGKSDNPYYTQKLLNQCVVCGDTESLTKHHIVPYCFRKYFPDNYKNHLSHDVLPLCVSCHEKYEILASQHKLKLIKSCETEERKKFYEIWKKAKSLSMYSEQMPEERKTQLLESIKDYYKAENVLDKILELAQIDIPFINTNWKEYTDTIKNIDEFIIEWRNNFVNTMQPQFLPKYWNTN